MVSYFELLKVKAFGCSRLFVSVDVWSRHIFEVKGCRCELNESKSFGTFLRRRMSMYGDVETLASDWFLSRARHYYFSISVSSHVLRLDGSLQTPGFFFAALIDLQDVTTVLISCTNNRFGTSLCFRFVEFRACISSLVGWIKYFHGLTRNFSAKKSFEAMKSFQVLGYVAIKLHQSSWHQIGTNAASPNWLFLAVLQLTLRRKIKTFIDDFFGQIAVAFN